MVLKKGNRNCPRLGAGGKVPAVLRKDAALANTLKCIGLALAGFIMGFVIGHLLLVWYLG